MRVLNWNVMWASPASPRGLELLSRIRAFNPDVAFLTETTLPFLDALGGFALCADADYGYLAPPHRRKVAIWSSSAWNNPETLGEKTLPSGRVGAAPARAGQARPRRPT